MVFEIMEIRTIFEATLQYDNLQSILLTANGSASYISVNSGRNVQKQGSLLHMWIVSCAIERKSIIIIIKFAVLGFPAEFLCYQNQLEIAIMFFEQNSG